LEIKEENKSTPEKARVKKRKLPMEENWSSKRSRQSPEVGEFKEESVMVEHGGSKANIGVMEDEEAPAVDDGIPEETRNLSILPGEIRYQYRFHFQVFNL
jgi:hypothetical protein